MRTTGDPLHDAAFAFDFRELEPAPAAPRALAVLLHGVGADELQLADLANALPADTAVVLPRGQRSISGGRIGWYRVSLAEDPPRIEEDEADEALAKLVAFVAQMQSRTGVPAARTWLAGFSQGGVLAASAALTAPAQVAGFAVVAGRILPEIGPRVAPATELAHLHALLVHGRDDATLPPRWAESACETLERLRVCHELRLHEAGHEPAAAMLRDVADWAADPARPWSARPG